MYSHSEELKDVSTNPFASKWKRLANIDIPINAKRKTNRARTTRKFCIDITTFDMRRKTCNDIIILQKTKVVNKFKMLMLKT